MRPPILAALLLLTAAAPAPPPEFDPIRFFTGATRGEGQLKIVLRAGQSVHVDGRGRLDGDTLVLDQVVTREGAAPKSRQWRIRRAGPGRYTGTLTDARGPLTGETEGDRLRLRYTNTDGFAIEQQLTLAPGGRSVQNRLTAKKLGVTVARLDETITKVD